MLRTMYRFALLICTFVLCINCALSAPPSILSALLSEKPQSAMVATAGGESSVQPKRDTGLTTYDQKQTGKYNIHLNIKDVAIIALDGPFDGGVGDFAEDYYEDYDLSDFTVKPIIGLIDITSNKPSTSSSTTVPPPLIHFEPDDESNQTESASNGTVIEEPIIKDKNQTHSVVLITGPPLPVTSAIQSDDTPSNESGILVTTSTSAPESLPPKLSLADLANVHSASPISFPIKPDEIPVQIILEQSLKQKQSSRQRPSALGHWRLRNRIPATPTPSSNRRITPPHIDSDGIAANPAIGNKHRKHSFAHAKRRNCVLNQNGQCQNSNRRFGSPTL